MALTAKMKFTKDFDPNAKSLIKHLCHHDLTKRYGALQDGIEQVKRHRFFEGLQFDKIATKGMNAPFKPNPVVTKQDLRDKVEGNSKSVNISYDKMSVSNNNKEFPPIKTARDPFTEWF